MKNKLFVLVRIFQFFCMILGAVVAVVLTVCGITVGEIPDIFPAIAIAFLISIVVIEIVSVFKISDSTFHTVLTAMALLLCYLVSADFLSFLRDFGVNPNYHAAMIVRFIAYLAVIVFNVIFLNYVYKLGVARRGWILLLSIAAVAGILYGVLSIFSKQYIAFALWLPACAYVHIKAHQVVSANGKWDGIFFLTTTVMSAETGMMLVEELNAAGCLTCGASGFATMYTLFIEGMFGIVYLSFIIRTDRASVKAEEYRLQAELLKTKVLQQQINPHYIYNSLTTVKEMYHHGCESGDYAINLFAKHLRANVNGVTADLVPFDEELENIRNYLDFENLKREKPIEVLFNIEFYQFKVPPLSLQVFAENSVRHGKVGDMPDGVIEISAFERGGEIVVGITDNGVGFNPEKIRDKACGISNSRARFSLLLGGKVEINSAVGKGTEVRVRLDKRTAALE
ncbi:MAG: sensor histidine kinase [Candidatus Coproplasma sp.]